MEVKREIDVWLDTPYTAGPWEVREIVPNAQLKPADRRNYAGDMAYIWTVRAYPAGFCVAKVKEQYVGQLKHNAQLIAIAPEMFEALRNIVQAVDRGIDALFESVEIAKARAVLAQVEGGTDES